MDIVEAKGITEIVGNPGVGKRTVALSLRNDLKTLYISSRIAKKKWFSENVVVERIDSFMKLRAYIARDIRAVVKKECVEKIILDGLEDYLYVFESPRMYSNEIFQIVNVLKELCFVDGIIVIVTNGSYQNIGNDVRICNSYLGLPWEYMINTRYLVTKYSSYRMISSVKGNLKIHRMFSISENGKVSSVGQSVQSNLLARD